MAHVALIVFTQFRVSNRNSPISIFSSSILSNSFTSSSLSPHSSEQNHFPRRKAPSVLRNFYGFPFIFLQPMSSPISPSSFNWHETKCYDSYLWRQTCLQNLYRISVLYLFKATYLISNFADDSFIFWEEFVALPAGLFGTELRILANVIRLHSAISKLGHFDYRPV